MTKPEYKGDTTAIGDKALEYFKSTVVYGVTSVDSIDFDNRESIPIETIRVWMKDRFNELMQMFYKDMRQFKLIGNSSVSGTSISID